MEEQYPHKELTGKIIGAAMEVYNTLGCGFLESVYEEALVVEFRLQNIDFERQKPLDVFYKGTKVKQFVCDFLVAGDVLVELKATKDLTGIDKAQVLNYLKSTNLKLGLLLNFGAGSLQYKRVIH
ncbi:MAG TPA: GxxExxY protein [Sedimentisphaerales bacterium]|nr:GxxExxY protein [Sedimentisphaerales bacterium]